MILEREDRAAGSVLLFCGKKGERIMAQTIAAVSTAVAPAGVSMIRISGDEALEVAARVFVPAGKKTLFDCKGYEALFGTIQKDGAAIDQAVALVFLAPHSYTGETVVELSCHGGIYVTRAVLRAVLESGARLAEPGEFTKRAFLNGKLSLTQAEAVIDLIEAKTRDASKAATSQLSGVLGKKINSVKDQLLKLAAHLSAWVDYPEDEIPEVDENEIVETAQTCYDEICALLDTYDAGRLIREGIDTVIVGKPNVGKSTLMNTLARYERSIVTDIAGTTRDVVEESVRLGDLLLRLSDTAGIRETDDRVEQIGVSIAKQRLAEASLVLAVFDGSSDWSEEDEELILMTADRPTVAIVNKNDLPSKTNMEKIQQSFDSIVEISAREESAATSLEKAIRKKLSMEQIDPTAPMLANERQRSCAIAAKESLAGVLAAVRDGMTFDAVTVLVEEAIEAILTLSGERVTEAVVDQVFSNFCVGK